jgi:transposase
VLQYSFSWKQLSVIAGLSYWRFYFRLFNGSIKSPQIVEFLKALQATIGKKLLIIWDRLQAHRSKLVKAHVEAQRGQIAIDYLPAYAPDMNPVECIWGYLKHHAMPNYCARDLGDVAHRARSNLRSMKRRTTLVTAFWKQVELFRACHSLMQYSITCRGTRSIRRPQDIGSTTSQAFAGWRKAQ